MNNYNSTMETVDLASRTVDADHFERRLYDYEYKYRHEFGGGSEEFLVSYKNGLTDPVNMDYDVWAFLYEHFMEERTVPWHSPGDFVSSQEKPETTSGFCVSGANFCLVLIDTSILGSSARSWIIANRWVM